MFRSSVLACLAALSVLAAAPAAHADDRVAFGGDAVVLEGETVSSVASFGGDAIVLGRVEGDVVSFGGDVELGPNADVSGSVASVGGEVIAAPGARFDLDDTAVVDHLPVAPGMGLGAWLEELGRQLVAHALLFLLALLLMGLASDRLGAMQVTIVRDPVRTGLFGLAGYVASVTLIVLLAITILGIPAAVALAILLPIATYVGLAASATVIGAALPLESLRDRPLHQLAAGVVLLFVASMVPVLGGLVVFAASCLGYGSLLRTRFRTTPPPELVGLGPVGGEGPYRSSPV
jgi:hypothetical protein